MKIIHRRRDSRKVGDIQRKNGKAAGGNQVTEDGLVVACAEIGQMFQFGCVL